MRKLVINTFITLDGVMQAPGGPEEDTTGGFEHGGWSFGYWDEAMGNWMGEAMGKPFALLLGRKTYEIFAAYWPQAGDQPGAAELNAATKYVASRTLDSVEWANSVLLEDDAAEAVARLKDADGPRSRCMAAPTSYRRCSPISSSTSSGCGSSLLCWAAGSGSSVRGRPQLASS